MNKASYTGFNCGPTTTAWHPIRTTYKDVFLWIPRKVGYYERWMWLRKVKRRCTDRVSYISGRRKVSVGYFTEEELFLEQI